jgi:hypothetical protein
MQRAPVNLLMAFALAAICVSSAANARATLIDDFSVFASGGEIVETGLIGSTTRYFEGDGDGTNPIGASRTLTVRFDVFFSDGTGDCRVDGNGFSISGNDVNWDWISWGINYGDRTPLNFDAMAGGSDRFRLHLSSPNADISMFLSVNDAAGRSAYVPYQPLTGCFVDLPFSAFINTSGQAVDFTSLSRIGISFTSFTPYFHGAATMSSFETTSVPEPLPIQLLGIGVAGLLVLGRKKKLQG